MGADDANIIRLRTCLRQQYSALAHSSSATGPPCLCFFLQYVREVNQPPLLSYSTNWCCNSNRAPRILSTSTSRDALLSAPRRSAPPGSGRIETICARRPVDRGGCHADRAAVQVSSAQPTAYIQYPLRARARHARARTFDRRCLCPCSVPRTLHWSGYEFRLVLRAGPQSKGCFQEMRAQCLFLGSEHARLMRGHRECDG